MTANGGIARIMVVDDEPQITQLIQSSLTASGYEVQTADDGHSALHEFQKSRADLIITDLSMPRMGGLALCQAIRSHSNVPIIVLSVKNQESTKILALESGADDYLTKPFRMQELLARVRAALRRASANLPETTLLEEGDFRVDLEARRTKVHGKEVSLTPKEFDLLILLLRNARKVHTHKSLLAGIWGRTYADQPDAVRVLVRHLRKKIEPNPALPKYLKTEPWVGYRFEPGG
jgi:two-component system, OmpR family, KDP operon response regulator KdpE